MRVKLRVLNTSLKGLQFETDKEVISVGRSPESDLSLQQLSVSRDHALIRNQDGAVTVEDAGSRNKTEVDGEAVFAKTPLRDGSIVSFGDVTVEVSLPDLVPAGVPDQEPEVTPERGSVVPYDEIEAELDEADVQVETAPAGAAIPKGWVARPSEAGLPQKVPGAAMERQFWPALALILGIAAAGVLVLFFMSREGGVGDPAQPPVGVALRVGDQKVVQVPAGFVNNWKVSAPEVVKVSHPWNLSMMIQLTGLSEGMATVRLHNSEGQYVSVHAKVLPRAQRKVPKLPNEGLLSDEERRRIARERMKHAELLRRQDDVYEAMVEYERAVSVLSPLAHQTPAELTRAEQERRKLATEIRDRYEHLTFEMTNFLKDGDRRMALQRLADVKQLVPDESDVRWQNADLLYRILEQVIEREKERRGRAL